MKNPAHLMNRIKNLLIKQWISITVISSNSRNNLIALMWLTVKSHPSTLPIFTKSKSEVIREGLRGRLSEKSQPREARIKIQIRMESETHLHPILIIFRSSIWRSDPISNFILTKPQRKSGQKRNIKDINLKVRQEYKVTVKKLDKAQIKIACNKPRIKTV